MLFSSWPGKYLAVTGATNTAMPRCMLSYCTQFCLADDYCVAFNVHQVAPCYCQLITEDMMTDPLVLNDDDDDWNFYQFNVVG